MIFHIYIIQKYKQIFNHNIDLTKLTWNFNKHFIIQNSIINKYSVLINNCIKIILIYNLCINNQNKKINNFKKKLKIYKIEFYLKKMK